MHRASQLSALLLASALALTACGGDADDGGDAAPGSSDPGVMAVSATDSLQFSDTELAAEAGEVSVELTCGDAVAHNITFDDGEQLVAECEGGGTGTGTITLEPGEYTFYCSIAGHREAGMEGTLTVA